MKTTHRLAALAILSATAALAQTATTPAKPAVHHATTGTAPAATRSACVKVPDLSRKIPALPAGVPCPKALYTIVTEPPVKLENVSPMESADLRKILGLEGTSITLAYVDTKVGPGPLALPHKWYTIKYTGYLVDGTKFDSSDDHPNDPPFSIPYGQHAVIPGWDTGFDGMHVGGKRRLFIPYQLAYGATERQGIPAKSELIFDVELLSQSDNDPTPKPPPALAAPATPAPAPAAPATPPATPPQP